MCQASVHTAAVADPFHCAVNGAKPGRRSISFWNELRLSEGSKRDWPSFARWHYRSHTLGPVKRVTLLWHGERAVGICVYCAPAAQLRLRNEFFGWSLRSRSRPRDRNEIGVGDGNGNGNRVANGNGMKRFLKMLNRTLWVLSRVVLHPTYRGAGIASAFVRQSCQSCPVPWIETLSVMGHANPFFERAGFVRLGVVRKGRRRDPETHARIYGGRHALSRETVRKSLQAQPVYYLFDNRKGRFFEASLNFPLAEKSSNASRKVFPFGRKA